MASTDVEEAYERRLPLLMQLAANLEASTKEALDEVAHIDRVAFRVKGLTSFATKAAQDKYTDPLREIEDQVAGRVIVFFRPDLEPTRLVLEDLFGAVESERKEPGGDAEFGYESDHYVFVVPDHHLPEGWGSEPGMPTTFEMQIRTLFQHAWAEPQHDLGYKGEGQLTRDQSRRLAWVAASAWGADMVMADLYVEIDSAPHLPP